MGSLANLPEIGAVTEKLLAAVGINDADTLRQVGAREAFTRIRDDLDPGACIRLLTGLECAVRGIQARELPDGDKAELRTWFRALPSA